MSDDRKHNHTSDEAVESNIFVDRNELQQESQHLRTARLTARRSVIDPATAGQNIAQHT